jgi:hypothetical protein
MSLAAWKREQLEKHGLRELYHLSSIDNLESILRRGILPRVAVDFSFEDIADSRVLDCRRGKSINLGSAGHAGLHEVALLFFTPLTPMLYRVVHQQNRAESICIITVDPFALCDDGIASAFGDGNLANSATQSYYTMRKLDEVRWDVIWAAYWTDFEDGTRLRSAEFVVHPYVPTAAITGVVVSSTTARTRAERAIAIATAHQALPVRIEPTLFFQSDGEHPAIEATPLFPQARDRSPLNRPPIPPPPTDADAPWI